jgi:poly(A) polymerase
MTEIWAMQPRFDQRFGKRPSRLLEHPRFRSGYDFLKLRCASGEAAPELGEWWSRFQYAAESERSQMLVRDGQTTGRGRRRRRRRRSGGAGGGAAQGAAPGAEG